MSHYLQRELDAHRATTPSARKSLREYKPLLVRKEGCLVRTEVLARAEPRNIDGNKTYARGLVFPTRAEAIAYAAEIKQTRIDDCLSRAKKFGIDVI